MLLAAALALELARESLTGTHCRFRLMQEGLQTEHYVTKPCVASDLEEVALRSAARLPAEREGRRWIDGRLTTRTIVAERPFEPWAHDYDAASGDLVRRTPLFFRGKPARVFDPNPVVTLNDPTLQDRHDRAEAVPAAAYADVELPDPALAGPWVTLVDRQPRDVAPPEGPALIFDREQDGFEDVSAYFHIDRNQRHLQSLGYAGRRAVVPYPIPVDAHAASGADNSYFIPSSTEAGRGTLYFGEGGTDDAEDADLLVHEYAHAVIEWIAPGTFGGAFASEARALGEGIGDYWAFSAHVAVRRESGRDPYCFADWDARCWQDAPSEGCGYEEGTDCLRRLDSTQTMADYETNETPGVEHRNGAIWASALREIHEKIGRTAADTIVVESLFGAPPRPTFAVMAERLLQADELLYQGAHAGAICSAMFFRGVTAQCDTSSRGERTLFQATTHNLAIPENSAAGITSTLVVSDARAIERLFVRVDIEHPSRGDLLVELIAPDGSAIVLHQLSSARTPDIHETFGLTAVPVETLDTLRGRSAAGEWKLFVADRRPRDSGRLQSWGLEIQFAGDTPLTGRPLPGQGGMIPVVTHVFGPNRTWQSDVRIANAYNIPTTASLIFTRSGENGHEHFAAVRLSLAGMQTVALDDVVQRTFRTFGSGTLQVVGDVVVLSRTDGQPISSKLDVTALGLPPLVAAAMPHEGSRVNLGVAETAGRRGVVRAGDREVTVEPFSHVQFPVPQDAVEIRVLEGEANVVAYLSQIGSDAMFIPAQALSSTRTTLAPVITSLEAGDSGWRSDAWFFSPVPAPVSLEAVPDGTATTMSPVVVEDVLGTLFHAVTIAALKATLPPGVFGATRIIHGNLTQFVPFLEDGPPFQHLLFVDNGPEARTNLGIASTGPASAELYVYDAAGVELERHELSTTGGVVQTAVRAEVVNGRAGVRFASGAGVAYASRIDVRTGDAMFVAGQPNPRIVVFSGRHVPTIAPAGPAGGADAGAASAQGPRRSDPATAQHAQ